MLHCGIDDLLMSSAEVGVRWAFTAQSGCLQVMLGAAGTVEHAMPRELAQALGNISLLADCGAMLEGMLA